MEGMASFFQCLLEGVDGPSLPALGVLCTFGAAKRDSGVTLYCLGQAFILGLLQDSVQAKRHICGVLEGKCSHRHSNQHLREEAVQLVLELG